MTLSRSRLRPRLGAGVPDWRRGSADLSSLLGEKKQLHIKFTSSAVDTDYEWRIACISKHEKCRIVRRCLGKGSALRTKSKAGMHFTYSYLKHCLLFGDQRLLF